MTEQKGVWRTVRGRRIFIADGEDLATAMKKSGKFEKGTPQSAIEEAKETNKEFFKKYGAGGLYPGNITKEEYYKKNEKGVRDSIKEFLSGRQNYDGSREDYIKDLSNEWGIDKRRVNEILHEENSKHPRNFNSYKNQSGLSNEEIKKNYQEYLKNYDYDRNKTPGQKLWSQLNKK
jgi:hypothetical protein